MEMTPDTLFTVRRQSLPDLSERGPQLIPIADFTNGWPVGFFSEIFSYGRQCSVGFDNAACPALAPHVQKNQQCAYTGVKVTEVRHIPFLDTPTGIGK